MNDLNKKESQEKNETGSNDKIELTVDELEKVVGGATFDLYEDENRRRVPL